MHAVIASATTAMITVYGVVSTEGFKRTSFRRCARRQRAKSLLNSCAVHGSNEDEVDARTKARRNCVPAGRGAEPEASAGQSQGDKLLGSARRGFGWAKARRGLRVSACEPTYSRCASELAVIRKHKACAFT